MGDWPAVNAWVKRGVIWAQTLLLVNVEIVQLHHELCQKCKATVSNPIH